MPIGADSTLSEVKEKCIDGNYDFKSAVFTLKKLVAYLVPQL